MKSLRIAIVNLMPQAERYEPHLLRPLRHAHLNVEPSWIRLSSHSYSSSDVTHLARHYRSIDQALAEGEIAGLIITGAPVEELPFSEVHYWRELEALIARVSVPVLGLCWGGLALAWQLGIEKSNFERKVFGVYTLRRVSDQGLFAESDDVFDCPQSRHSGILDSALEQAAAEGRVRLLAHAPETGYSIFESPDGQRLMHLGHPEYDAERLVYEYRRDRALGRSDVGAPAHLDLDQPITRWRSHRNEFFRQWLLRCRARAHAHARHQPASTSSLALPPAPPRPLEPAAPDPALAARPLEPPEPPEPAR